MRSLRTNDRTNPVTIDEADSPMEDLGPQEISPWIVLGVLLFAAASLLAFMVAAVQFIRGKLAPYEWRRRVPWGAIDLLVVFLAYGCLIVVISMGAAAWFGLEPITPTTPRAGEGLEAAHPLMVLMNEDPSVWTLLLCGAVAILMAPIVEEFLFRLLLQGWMESAEGRLRRWFPAVRRLIPGTVPIVLASLLFASLHYRASAPVTDPRRLMISFVAVALASLLTMAAAIVLVRLRTGATARDFGFVPEKLPADVGLGLLAFLALAAPIYLLQVDLRFWLPTHPVVDPITLFFFAMALGTLYYRTHRIVPSIVAHMALNTTSLIWAWYILAG